jgi:hypothetical protein
MEEITGWIRAFISLAWVVQTVFPGLPSASTLAKGE